MTDAKPLGKRLEIIFEKTKIVCFGRYSMKIPNEASIIIGKSALEVITGRLDARTRKIKEEIEKIKWADETADFTYNDKDPIEGSWNMAFWQKITTPNRKSTMWDYIFQVSQI